MHSNLGGSGPDAGDPTIRYANVGATTIFGVGTLRFDLLVSATSSYAPYDASLNGLSGRFARINFAANTQTDLRVRVFRSCCTEQSCAVCADSALSTTEQAACYTAGCCCFGHTCTTPGCCAGSQREAWRLSYGCSGRESDPIILPSTSLVGLAVYDLDSGADGEYTERIVARDYAYYASPLRPSSGDELSTTLAIDRATGTFTSTARGTSDDNPTDPQVLTDEQARRGVQLFYRPQLGYVEMTFNVTYHGSDAAPEGRNLLFAGDSAVSRAPIRIAPAPVT